jgi:hypothetical protein
MRALLRSVAFALVLSAHALSVRAGGGLSPDVTLRHSLELFSPIKGIREKSIGWLQQHGGSDAIAALVLALRFNQTEEREISLTLEKLAGEKVSGGWFGWMLWQQAHPEVLPFAGFDRLHAAVMTNIDPNFAMFLYPGVAHEIRLEEITWGGVSKDGIPALTNPKQIAAGEAGYLGDEELVFGVAIGGEARAYPFRIMDWHEMFNDVVGGVPVSLAYCTLCGSGILFETKVAGREQAFVFGSSGFLYRSNKLMYDQETHSLWNQFTGRPVVGPLTGSGTELATRPVVITTWSDWRNRNPATTVLALDTGFDRNYRPGAAYGSYFSSDELMFPALVDQSKLKAKDYVFALRSSGAEKAWPLSLFETHPVINDTAGVLNLTLVGDVKTRSVRAYRTGGERFAKADRPDRLLLDGKEWQVTEDALAGPDGQLMRRLPGHVAYWFAWNGYLGGKGELATAPAE